MSRDEVARPTRLPPESGYVQLLGQDGELVDHPDYTVDFTPDEYRQLYRDLVTVRALDAEATSLQRQGELGLWASLLGQEAAQIGSARALRPQDTAFPTYREHGVLYCRGVDPLAPMRLFRGVSHGGWDPTLTRCQLYTLVIGAQTLHATGYAMGVSKDGKVDDGDKGEAVIAYFGDGASSQGDVNEAFVWSSVFNVPVVFFCQNNQYAISQPVERQSRVPLSQRAAGFGFPGVRVDGNDILAVYAVTRMALDRARRGEGPSLIEAYTYRLGAHTTSDDPTRYRSASEVEVWQAKDPITRMRRFVERQEIGSRSFFEDVDAQAKVVASRLRERVLSIPDPLPGEMFDHVYVEEPPFLEDQRREFQDYLLRLGEPVGPDLVAGLENPVASVPFDGSASNGEYGSGSSRGTGGSRTEVLTLGRALNAGLRRALESDPKVIVMGEDVGRLGGVFRITDGLQKDFGEDRVIDTPLSEAGIVGTAIGLALRGYRPICEIQFDGFVFPAYDQIVSQLAKMRYRSGGLLRLPIVIRIPYGGGIGAVEHHSESPEASFAHVAGLKVVSCATPEDAYWMIQQAVMSDDPIIFFEPKRRYWDKAQLTVSSPDHEPWPLHSARVVRVGGDATVVAYGPMLKTALDAAGAAAEFGRTLEIVDVRSLSPLDLGPVYDSVRRTGRLVIVHEAPGNLGIGAEIAARVTEECFYFLEAPVLRVTGFDTPYPPARLEDGYLPDVDRILDAVDRAFGW